MEIRTAGTASVKCLGFVTWVVSGWVGQARAGSVKPVALVGGCRMGLVSVGLVPVGLVPVGLVKPASWMDCNAMINDYIDPAIT